jgi:hypothetical protein
MVSPVVLFFRVNLLLNELPVSSILFDFVNASNFVIIMWKACCKVNLLIDSS